MGHPQPQETQGTDGCGDRPPRLEVPWSRVQAPQQDEGPGFFNQKLADECGAKEAEMQPLSGPRLEESS